MFKDRAFLLDNTKIALIFLMIYGHMIQSFITVNMTYKSVFLMIYSFHMPLLSFISGVVSKAAITNNNIKRFISKLAVPLIAFQVVYELPMIIFNSQITDCTFNLQPNALQWYLLSLLSWRLMLPLFDNLHYPIIFSFFVALFSGVCPLTGEYLGISRTLYLFPYFLMGHYLGMDKIRRLKFKGSSFLYAGILVVAAGIFVHWPEIKHGWMYGSYAYAVLGHKEWYAAGYRVIVYCSSIIIGTAFLGLVPSAKTRLTYLGEHSLYIYLWSGMYVVALGSLKVQSYVFKFNVALSLSAFFLISMAIVYLLSAKEVITFTDNYVFRPVECLLMPKNSRLYTQAVSEPGKEVSYVYPL